MLYGQRTIWRISALTFSLLDPGWKTQASQSTIKSESIFVTPYQQRQTKTILRHGALGMVPFAKTYSKPKNCKFNF
jgi:hypothetical protein